MSHGNVWVKLGQTELASCAEYQHNKNYRNRFDLNDDIISEIEDKMESLLKVSKPPSFIESDIPTRAEYNAWVAKSFPDYKEASLW